MSKEIKVALAGNPNSGKTTAFNAITGARQHVGNYPGITVDKKEGFTKVGENRIHLIDLPGTYSLTAYTMEEIVARNVVADQRPDVVIDVLNAGALERNLYLAIQLMEMGAPIVLALNMMDEANKQGMKIDIDKLADLLNVPVVETVARTGEGIQELLTETVKCAAKNEGKKWEPLSISYGPDLDPALNKMVDLIEKNNLLTDRYPSRWTALKYLESDDEIMQLGREAHPVSAELEEVVKSVSKHLESTLATYPEAVIADYRYGYITSIIRQGVVTRLDAAADRVALSDKIDTIVTHRFLGPIIMLAVMYLIYQVTFTFSETPVGWFESFFGWLGETAEANMNDGLLKSLVISGVIDGVGGVMGFVPLIMFMFLQIAILEDSGYMARVAYMLDRVFRFFGLHGCSVMPFIVSGGIAGGCAVPGVMAARTLRSPKEKLATLITAPFMACGAKLPVFLLFVGVFFEKNQAMVMFMITMVAWACALIVSKILRNTVIKGEATPFVMELPPYRFPTLRGLFIHTWERTWQYIKKAGTVILAISILIWAAMTFPNLPEDQVAAFDAQKTVVQEQIDAATASGAPVAELEEKLLSVENEEAEATLKNSYAGSIGVALEPIMSPAGFDWRTNIALVGGFAAKEVIVSTLGTAYSLGEVDPEDASPLAERIAQDPNWTPATAIAFLLFVLLYAPCFVTVVAIKQEANSWKWAIFSVVFNTALAYTVAVAVVQIGKLL
ncbi:ferrous iron transport protein B [Halodesulfovibrio spirochaetisodalis]|uniref:Ferrous iron transport protein B n=1 Tax=Halodesulfovibrio spirochaetisodalis TaxID=1560234 RepID=A0A1B7XAQ1_9BACT|nr:ferrous iron transport protein B [Halodesulfovibrio spirochaetisodalis]OBQ46448.1 iron transporter FeoB [Halodesulfovibrio spirochaetisodalis]